MKYDIFVSDEVDFTDSRFRLFLRRDPVAKLFESAFIGQRKGYLGVSTDAVKAIWLGKCLRKNGVTVYVTKSEVRDEIDELLAVAAAERGFLDVIERFPGYDFSIATRIALNGALALRAFGFSKQSEKMANEGFTPPAVFLYIDKYDLHVLTAEELLEVEILDTLINS
jgi:hypothetical protein